MTAQRNTKSVLHEKSLHFAVESVRLSEHLSQSSRNYRLADQILRSGTSIGANIRESTNAESSADFVHKLSIALKECGETLYWLDVLVLSERITQDQFEQYSKLASELHAMLTAAIKTMKRKGVRKL